MNEFKDSGISFIIIGGVLVLWPLILGIFIGLLIGEMSKIQEIINDWSYYFHSMIFLIPAIIGIFFIIEGIALLMLKEWAINVLYFIKNFPWGYWAGP